MPEEWHTAPSGDACEWCGGLDSEPFDEDDAELRLCRGHLAEWRGDSLESMDRADEAAYADMITRPWAD